MLSDELRVVVDWRLLACETKTERTEIHDAAHAGLGVQSALAPPEEKGFDTRMRKESSGGDVGAVEIVAGNVLVEASLIDLHHGCGERIHPIALAGGAESSCVESARGVGPEE